MTESETRPDASRPLRVVHVFRAPVGGLFRHVCDLARALSERQTSVGIICDASSGGDSAATVLRSLDDICDLGVHRVAMRRTPGLSDLFAVQSIRPILRSLTPDIVHGHGAKGAAYARLLAPALQAKTVYTPHGGVLHFSPGSVAGRMYISLERLLKKRTNGVIFESEFARQGYRQKIGPTTFPECVVHNGLYDDEFSVVTRDDADYDFVFVGELRKLKGIYELVEAAASVRQVQPVRLLIVGAGNEEANLRARIDRLEMSDSITVSAPIHPATAAFRRARCVVVPSLHESFPYVVLEALAAALPVLTTHVGGIPEMFGPFEGELIQPGNSSDLAQAMLSILQDPESAQAKADALREHVKQRFRISTMSAQTIAFYRSICGVIETSS